MPGTIRNPLGSAALGLLNDTLFYKAPDGALFPDLVDIDPSNFDGPVVKAATIISFQALGKYDSNYAQQNDLYLGGQIGNSTYEDLDTGGIGVNVNSYLRFSGDGDFFNPPTNYTFSRLTGVCLGYQHNRSVYSHQCFHCHPTIGSLWAWKYNTRLQRLGTGL